MPSVKFYQNGDFHPLSGAKIFQNGAWIKILSHSKIWLNGAWHDIGGSAENPVAIPSVSEQSLTHENGTEPTSGTIWYITPDGTGNMDGSSWANAASGSMIHVILLSCASGDSVYFAEGDYTVARTIVLPAGVNLYGGFDTDRPAWETRNGFINQTIFTGNNTFGWMDGSAATSGQIVDGFVVKNYNSTITGSNATLRNSIVTMGTASLTNAYNSVFVSATANVSNASHCNFFYEKTSVTSAADHVVVCGTNSVKINCCLANAQFCTAVNCYSSNSGNRTIFLEDAKNCTAVNCSCYTGSIFANGAKNCTAVNCSCSSTSDGSYTGTIFLEDARNCTAVNCYGNRLSSIFANDAKNCTAVNCSCYIGAIFSHNAKNCTAVNCCGSSTSDTIFSHNAKNCLSWNNTEKEFSSNPTTSAGSTYNNALALTLGTDNSIARFTNTGYYPAQGVQDVGDCPNPIDDPTGYAAYLAAFGDWHPLANSFLIGKGTADSNVTTDADGVTRPDPPTIGAYEPRPA